MGLASFMLCTAYRTPCHFAQQLNGFQLLLCPQLSGAKTRETAPRCLFYVPTRTQDSTTLTERQTKLHYLGVGTSTSPTSQTKHPCTMVGVCMTLYNRTVPQQWARHFFFSKIPKYNEKKRKKTLFPHVQNGQMYANAYCLSEHALSCEQNLLFLRSIPPVGYKGLLRYLVIFSTHHGEKKKGKKNDSIQAWSLEN